MSDSIWVMLQRAFEADYPVLETRLTRLLGSHDQAKEVLHEVYVRLHAGRGQHHASIGKPVAYLTRMAINVARDMDRDTWRHRRKAEALQALSATQSLPNFADEMDVHFRVGDLKKLLDTLPPQRLAILLAAMVEGASHDEIAERFKISKKGVQKQLRKALDHCVRHAEKD